MLFAFERVASLPPLAWCAEFRLGAGSVSVRHGSWVETRPDAFFEGAWDEDLSASPDTAVAQVGTSGRLRGDAIVFGSASNTQDRLYVARVDAGLLVSNSLCFLFVAADDEPDPGFPDALSSFLGQARAGIRRARRELPTRRGEVLLHECANLAVRADLSLEREEKRPPAEPVDFDDYVALLEGTIGRLFANATDPRRARRYVPLASLSRGYDSPAVAAIARRVGCGEAITFAEGAPGIREPDDDGSAIAVRLGLAASAHARLAYRARGGLPEAEFCVLPPGGDVVWASVEEQLPGRLLLTGRYGDDVLGLGPAPPLPDLRQHSLMGLGGASLTEIRLRIGFLNFAPLVTGWQHAHALRRIARSEAMRPWSIGGEYDRPLARRIVEEAGVPRELFGQHKLGGAFHHIRSARHLGTESRADYAAFIRRLGPRLSTRAVLHTRRIAWRLRGSGGRANAAPFEPPAVPRFENAWLFQWGVQRTRERYRT